MRTVITVTLLSLLLCISVDVQAIMHTEANGLIARDSNDTYWLTDLTLFANKTPRQIEEAVCIFSLDGYYNFRISSLYGAGLPSTHDVVQYFSPTLYPMGPSVEWVEYRGLLVVPPYYIDYGNQEYGFTILGIVHDGFSNRNGIITDRDYISQGEDISSPYWGAWVICDKGTAPVPEPSTFILLVTGLTGAGIFYVRKRKCTGTGGYTGH